MTKIFSISRNTINLGNVIQNPKPTYIEEGYLKKGEFKRLFIKKDGALIDEIIQNSWTVAGGGNMSYVLQMEHGKRNLKHMKMEH